MSIPFKLSGKNGGPGPNATPLAHALPILSFTFAFILLYSNSPLLMPSKVSGKNGVPGLSATPLAHVAKESEHELAQHLPYLEATTKTALATQLRRLHALMMLKLAAARTLFRGSEPPTHPFINHLVKTGPVQVGSEP